MSRLTELLSASDIDVDRLSQRTQIPANRIHEIVEGADPSIRELRRLAEALKVPLIDFVEPTEAEEKAQFLFRGASIAGKPVPTAALHSLSRTMSSSVEILQAQRRAVAPWWLSEFEPADETLENAEHNASVFRRLFFNNNQLAPLLSLPHIVSTNMDALLFVLSRSEFDGASALLDGIPFFFISARFPGRMLFTLAHECGHVVSHHDPAESFAIIDESTGVDEAVSRRNGTKSEAYADAFASALLMPRAGVGITLRKVRQLAKITEKQIGDIEIGYLARIYGVSFWAAARRCEDLTLIPRGGAAALNDKLVKQYGSAEKRAEEAGLPPRPEIDFPRVPAPLLASAIERVRAGELSVGRAAAVLGISVGDLIAANAPTAH